MSGQNGIRVEDMLKMDIMREAELLAGYRGVARAMSSISIVSDPAVLGQLEPGEFLLTTGYYFLDDKLEDLKKLIVKAVNKKLSGIGIKLSPYLEEIDQEVLDLADELNIPIISLDENLALADILSPVSCEIFKKQASLLDRIESVQSKFTSAILNGKGLGEIVSTVEENIKNPTVLSLAYMDKLLTEMGDLDQESQEVFLGQVENFNQEHNGFKKQKRIMSDKILYKGRFIKRLIVPIVLQNNVYGHMFAWATDTPLASFDTSILESAATAIALSVLQDLSIKEVEIRYRSEFFEDLISSDKKRRGKALERAHYLNLTLDSYYLVEVMSFKFKSSEEEPIYEYLQKYSNMIVLTIEDSLEYYGLDAIVSTKLNGIQILLTFDNTEKIDRRVEEFNKRLYEILRKKYPFMDIYIGIGRVYHGLRHMNKSFEDAIKAIRTGRLISEKNIISYNELGIFKILCQDSLNEELKDFYKNTLESLVVYDQQKSTDLVKTLKAYFKFNGNLTRMSEYLYTHYNTILYRINRINEISGMDLEDENDRLNLEIALKIRELL